MATASIRTKLSLAEFAKIAGFNPLHFEQVAFTKDSRQPSVCEAPVLQYPWQSRDRVSREDIAQAIADAEAMIERQLKWRLIPSWETNDWQQGARPRTPEAYGWNRDVRYTAPAMQTNWRKFISGGVEAKTLVQADAPIVWTELDSGVRIGTVTLPAGVFPACEAEVYYPEKNGAAVWQIRPATPTITGGNLVITFRRELCVIEELKESLNPEPAKYDDDNDFLDVVDVYRHYNDPSVQATAMWQPSGCGTCEGTGCTQCSYASQGGCLSLRSRPEESMVSWSAGNWNAETTNFDFIAPSIGTNPELVRLYYYAGNQDPEGTCPRVMEPTWARAVTYAALANIERPICDCNADTWEYWREDLALLSGGEQFKTYSFTMRDAAGNNPFGSRRGHLFAWSRVVEPDVAAVRGGTLT